MTEMTYNEARSYAAQLAKGGSVYGLDNIRNLMRELSDVQEQLPIIHIAGTNGKGSVGAFLAAGLQEAGYLVGRYTSPAVFDPLEVWTLNGQPMTREEYAFVFSRVRCACERLAEKKMPQPTLFEVETAAAFLWFYQKKCDYVLLETGMGGALDATNLITRPVCAVITSISMDHMKFLGSTLPEIAQAKAGIIKAGCPVVAAGQKPEVMEVLRRTAAKQKAPFLTADVQEYVKEIHTSIDECSYECRDIGTLTFPMAGLYQIENSLLAACVLKEVLHAAPEVIQKGFGKVNWRGRFEILGKNPLFVIDGAHNEDAAEKLCATVRNYFTNRRITYIIGVLADKEYKKILERMLPLAECVYTVTPGNPRALAAEELAEAAKEILQKPLCRKAGEVPVAACTSVAEAVRKAKTSAGRDGIVLAFGSLSYLGEVRRAWEEDAPIHTERCGES